MGGNSNQDRWGDGRKLQKFGGELDEHEKKCLNRKRTKLGGKENQQTQR